MEVEERRAERSGASSTPSFERQMPDCMPSPLPPGTPAESQGSDSGCSCCQSDAEHKLTQRRSASQVKRSMLTDSPESSAAIPSKVMQERVLWGILLMACSALLFSILPLESTTGILAALNAAKTTAMDTLLPQGPYVWKLQWRTLGRPDPRPLWDTQMLGSKTDWPHGSATAFATALGGRGGSRTIAVVGNGPITDDQRREVEAADKVVRFNAMNNRKPEERVDVWIVRHNNIPPHPFWGFQQLEDAEIERTVRESQAVLFLGGSQHHNRTEMADAVDRVLFWFPDIADSQVQQVNVTGYWETYDRVLSWNASSTIEAAKLMPSSGLLGLLAVLAAVGPDVQIDLYGFNWNIRSYSAHRMSAEELIIREVRRHHPGSIELHPTACQGLYSCDSLCDTPQFRLAVDGASCQKQLERLRQGKAARFIDQHTFLNLDWNTELKKELKLKFPDEAKTDAQKRAWLKKAASRLLDNDDFNNAGRQSNGADQLSTKDAAVTQNFAKTAFAKFVPEGHHTIARTNPASHLVRSGRKLRHPL